MTHGVPEDVVATHFRESAAFFALLAEGKLKLKLKLQVPALGGQSRCCPCHGRDRAQIVPEETVGQQSRDAWPLWEPCGQY